jgi:chromosome segregation ATPase
MTTLSDSVKIVSGLVPGRKKYKSLFDEQVASRIDEQTQQFETLSDSVKTANGAIQLAMQQIAVLNKRQAELNKQLAEAKALPSPDRDGAAEAEGTEVKGE